VTPKVSWKYNAVGRPLFSEAEGRTRLEDLGNGTTRVHFSETYHAFNPFTRALLEKRVHAFISKDNDRLIKDSLTKGVGYLRSPPRPRRRRRQIRTGAGRRRSRPGVTVVDLWVNALTGKAAAAFLGQAGNEGIPELSRRRPLGLLHAAAPARHHGQERSTSASSPPASPPRRRARCSNEVAAHPDRLRVALTSDRPDRPVPGPAAARLAEHPAVALVRITPLVHQYPLNDKLYYPVYTACAELGLPVSINVGIPGPACARPASIPTLLEDVLIDFKGLTVIGAHMGHPYEALLMQYMLKWPDLYLSNSAYLAKYMDPALVSFMDSSRGMGRVLFASDHPSSRWSGPRQRPGDEHRVVAEARRPGPPPFSRRQAMSSRPPRREMSCHESSAKVPVGERQAALGATVRNRARRRTPVAPTASSSARSLATLSS
jgi:hypothetical protein